MYALAGRCMDRFFPFYLHWYDLVNFTQGFSRKGTALCYLNRYEEAATVFMEGLEIDPDNQQLKNGLEEANSHLTGMLLFCLRRVWRYQSGNQNPYIEEE